MGNTLLSDKPTEQPQREQDSSALPCSPWGIAAKLARHPIHDQEWLELGQELLPYLKGGENFTNGAMRILADRAEWLENQWEETKELLHAVGRGDVDSRLRRDRDMWKRKFLEKN